MLWSKLGSQYIKKESVTELKVSFYCKEKLKRHTVIVLRLSPAPAYLQNRE